MIGLSLLLAGFGFLGIPVVTRFVRWRPDLWMSGYLQGRKHRGSSNRTRPQHILFCLADHFEPNHGGVTDDKAEERIRKWMSRYPSMANRFRDSDGYPPRHTWFFGSHHDRRFLFDLSSLAFRGYGEVEYHLHHEKDTEESLRDRITEEIKDFSRCGCLVTTGSFPSLRYAFIHGNWALSNSDGGKHCGVNEELGVLEETGCFADFTMPSFGRPQSRKVNSIYYPDKTGRYARGHDRGMDLEAGRKNGAGMICIQGPLGVAFRRGRPRLENASVTVEDPAVPRRIESWIDAGIGVKGRPDWIFVKVHTHGAIERDWDAVFGNVAEEMHRCLTTRYNDGEKYRLHYVTAREMYNIARAAEAGLEGNPDAYRNYDIPPYANTRISSNRRYMLHSCTETTLDVSLIDDSLEKLEMRFNEGFLDSVSGNFDRLRIEKRDGEVAYVYSSGAGEGNISINARCRMEWKGGIDAATS